MIYKAMDFTGLLGMEGFSHELLTRHFALYEGYVKNANRLLESLTHFQEKDHMEGPEFSEIQRRLSFELNGIKLHEYYFENMGRSSGNGPDKENIFYKKASQDFGSYKKWESSFRAVTALRGVGWALVIYEPRADRLINTWVDEHHLGHVAGSVPILVLDLWEHAMLLDYGSDRGKYVDAFFEVLDWGCITSRVSQAIEFQELHQI